jgi:chemotaxis protein CheD
MSELIVGISDLKVSKNQGDVLITYALGSCIGVTVYDPKARVGGLLHFMLPDSSLDANKAKTMPCSQIQVLHYCSNPVMPLVPKKKG